MVEYYKENIQLYFVFILWLIIGVFSAPLSYAFVAVTTLLMYKKGMYQELILGYFFVLILSDSLEWNLSFAKSLKNIYISLLTIFFLLDFKSFQPLNRLYKIFIPFFVFSIFTMLFSVNEPFFFTSIQKTLSYFLTFLVVPNIIIKLYRDKGPEFFRTFLFFATTILLTGFVLKYVAHDVAFLEGGRYRGLLGNPNGLGIVCLLLFIIFVVINNRFPDLFSKNERILIVVAILLSLYFTGSRNAIIAISIFYLFQRFFHLSPFLGFIIFAVALFLSDLISNNIAEIILSLGLGDFFRINTLEEGSGRYIAWEFAWLKIQENFFIGKGFAYNEFFMRQNYDLLGKLGHQGGIHNSFLTFWMDHGLIGLLIYLRSYVLVFIKAAKNSKYSFPIMFAIAFSAMFESWLVGSLSPFAFLGVFIFTIMASDELISQPVQEVQLQLNITSDENR